MKRNVYSHKTYFNIAYVSIWGSARENWAFAIIFKFSNLTVFGYRIALSTKQFLRIQNWTVYHRATKR